jgi:hypothetical protein
MPVMLPVRVQAHHALALLSVPASPWLIAGVHAAFSGFSDLTGGALVRLLRDEERAYRGGASTSSYHLCPALTAGDLAPARGLIAVSTWPLEHRVIGPLSRRVCLLTALVRLAGHAARLPGASPAVTGLLRGLAAEVPGGLEEFDPMRPWLVAGPARAALAGCAAADAEHRAEAAARALAALNEAELLYGRVPADEYR